MFRLGEQRVQALRARDLVLGASGSKVQSGTFLALSDSDEYGWPSKF